MLLDGIYVKCSPDMHPTLENLANSQVNQVLLIKDVAETESFVYPSYWECSSDENGIGRLWCLHFLLSIPFT